LSGEVAFRATEFTVGESGPRAMPGALPPSSAYTYAVELGLDEAADNPEATVRFDRPLIMYLENFLEMPVGGVVPAGFYDRRRKRWVAVKDGRVVKVVSIKDGRAQLDVDGDGQPDRLDWSPELGLTSEELDKLGKLYKAGQTLWRVPVEHFTPYDLNWSPAPQLQDLPDPEPLDLEELEEDPCTASGSIIEADNRVLGEVLPLVGTPFALSYRSDRQASRTQTLQLRVWGSDAIPEVLTHVEVDLEIAGQRIRQRIERAQLRPNMVVPITWDGLDAFGRPVFGRQGGQIVVRYVTNVPYQDPDQEDERSFGRPASDRVASDVPRAVVETVRRVPVTLGRFDARASHGMGGWMLDVQHAYDPVRQELYPGVGPRRERTNYERVVRPAVDMAALDASMELPFALQGATPYNLAVGPDGSLYHLIQVHFAAEGGTQAGLQIVRYDPKTTRWSHIAGRVLSSDDPALERCQTLIGGCTGSGPKELILPARPGADRATNIKTRLSVSPIDGTIYVTTGWGCVHEISPAGEVKVAFGKCTGEQAAVEVDGQTYLTWGIWDVDVSPQGVLYVSTGTYVFARWTADQWSYVAGGGATFWDGTAQNNSQFFAVSISAQADGALYLRDYTGVMHRRADGTWTRWSDPALMLDQVAFLEERLPSMDVDVDAQGRLYASGRYGVFRLRDEGGWEAIIGGTPPDQAPVGPGGERRRAAQDIPASAAITEIYDFAIGDDGVIWSTFIKPGRLDANLRRVEPPFPELGSESYTLITASGYTL
ncbi:MAG: hypothetical protein KC492_42280, partial [Myxococcales bacterium]|nr:hypothetical protein [Myxococcales bacterium]